jgi:glucose/arabinose dehydrogenase
MMRLPLLVLLRPALLLVALLLAPAVAVAKPVISRDDVPVLTEARGSVVVEGLEHPWGMAWLPDGAMLITEKPGRLRLVRDGALDPRPIAGVPAVFAGGQGGLLDVAIDPDFAETRAIFLTYAAGTGEANRTTVARATLDGMSLRDVTVIFQVAQAKPRGQHFGSRLLFLPDKTLLVSIGDGGNPPTALDGEFIRNNAQKRTSHFGKIVRLNRDGTIPADNPFVNRKDADPAVWSYGHRNIQGLAHDPVTGAIWANEHGALGGDELNRVTAGTNFGWPAVTHSREYVGARQISPDTSRKGMADPVLVWAKSTAPSGLMVYTGSAFPQWRGSLFSGGLATQDVRRIALDAKGTVVAEEGLRIGQRVRDVRQGPDGLIYVLTDERMGRLLRFAPAAP